MNIRVLHRIDTFLNRTANWIYPQATKVLGTESGILCDEVVNTSEYPFPKDRVFVQKTAHRNVKNNLLEKGLVRMLDGLAHRKAHRLLRSWKPQIIHAHFGMEGWRTLPLKIEMNIPMVTTFYGYDAWSIPIVQPYWCDRFKHLFAVGELFLVEGSAFRQRLIALGCPPAKIKVQHLGVETDWDVFRTDPFSEKVRVIMVGRFVEKKGLIDGLVACQTAIAMGADLEITIVGDFVPGDSVGMRIKESLLSIAQSPELAGRTTFTGFLPHAEVRRLIREHDVLLSPSKHAASGDAEGGLPFVMLEAMAMGLVCVGSNHCDMPDAILDGVTGFMFEESNVQELSGILTKLSQSQTKLSTIALAGRDRVKAEFNLETQLTALGDVYRSLVAH